MKPLRIKSNNVIKQFWCKKCHKAHNSLTKVENDSFCEECVPEQFKDKLVTVDQNIEKIN